MYNRYHAENIDYEEGFVDVFRNPFSNILDGIKSKITVETLILIATAYILLIDTEDRDLIWIVIILILVGI